MKINIKKFLCCMTVFAAAMGFISCSGDDGESHKHTFTAEWTTDATTHWHAATCGHKDQIKEKAAHTWNHEEYKYDDVSGKIVRNCTVCKYTNVLEDYDTYKIEYELNGGSWAEGFTPVCEFNKYQKITLPGENDLQRSVESFLCWFDNPELKGKPVTEINNELTSDIKLYADYAIFCSTVNEIREKLKEVTADECKVIITDNHEAEEILAQLKWGLININLDLSRFDSSSFNNFDGYRNLKSIIYPANVSATDYFFKNCSSLTGFEIPDRVTAIKDECFSGCTSLKNITIPDSVTSIGAHAFADCSSLESIIIPNSVSSIGKGAFTGCSSLTGIEIPDGVTSIEESTFFACTGLKSIVIPGTVKSIGDGAFGGCSLTNITIPGSVTSIGIRAFAGCENLSSIIIPDGVTFIGERTFSYCSSLTNIILPDSVTSIGSGAFAFCISLTSIKIPDGVISIEAEAFSMCGSLTAIEIPDSVTSIGWEAFSDCTSLTTINYKGTEEQWNTISKEDSDIPSNARVVFNSLSKEK